MNKILLLVLSVSFFFGNFQNIFANQCLDLNISNYFLEFGVVDKKGLDNYILYYRDYLKSGVTYNKKNSLKDIEKMNQNFIDSQDQKFSVSIEYVLKKFNQDDEKKTGIEHDEKNDVSNVLEELKTGSGSDFFIKKYLIEKKNTKKVIKNIPTSILQKSVYLDFYIFSCELGNFKSGKGFQAGGSISEFVSKTDSIEFEKNEILKKQQIVVERSISKYQSFLTHREMYIALRGVIEKLESLKLRFEDFTRLIGFLPSKIVDFGYQKNN